MSLCENDVTGKVKAQRPNNFAHKQRVKVTYATYKYHQTAFHSEVV